MLSDIANKRRLGEHKAKIAIELPRDTQGRGEKSFELKYSKTLNLLSSNVRDQVRHTKELLQVAKNNFGSRVSSIDYIDQPLKELRAIYRPVFLEGINLKFAKTFDDAIDPSLKMVNGYERLTNYRNVKMADRIKSLLEPGAPLIIILGGAHMKGIKQELGGEWRRISESSSKRLDVALRKFDHFEKIWENWTTLSDALLWGDKPLLRSSHEVIFTTITNYFNSRRALEDSEEIAAETETIERDALSLKENAVDGYFERLKRELDSKSRWSRIKSLGGLRRQADKADTS